MIEKMLKFELSSIIFILVNYFKVYFSKVSVKMTTASRLILPLLPRMIPPFNGFLILDFRSITPISRRSRVVAAVWLSLMSKLQSSGRDHFLFLSLLVLGVVVVRMLGGDRAVWYNLVVVLLVLQGRSVVQHDWTRSIEIWIVLAEVLWVAKLMACVDAWVDLSAVLWGIDGPTWLHWQSHCLISTREIWVCVHFMNGLVRMVNLELLCLLVRQLVQESDIISIRVGKVLLVILDIWVVITRVILLVLGWAYNLWVHQVHVMAIQVDLWISWLLSHFDHILEIFDGLFKDMRYVRILTNIRLSVTFLEWLISITVSHLVGGCVLPWLNHIRLIVIWHV